MTTSYLIHHQPPTTNHNLLIAGWKKHVWKKKTPFFEAYTKAHKWQHLLENCPTPGNSWSAMHLVEKASAESWLVFAGSPNTRNVSFCKENSFRRSLFLTCTSWFKPWPNSIPPVGGHFSNFWVRVMEFHSPRKLQGAGKTIVARNLARKNRCNNRWLPKEHLLAYLKMVGKPLQKWHPIKKNPTPYNIYTFSTGHWVYIPF